MALLAAIHRIITFAGDYGLCHPKNPPGKGGFLLVISINSKILEASFLD
jgi:hypothetical protein